MSKLAEIEALLFVAGPSTGRAPLYASYGSDTEFGEIGRKVSKR